MLSQLPRFLSFPKQVYVEYEDALQNLLKLCNGTRPCYITPYVFHTRETCTVDCIITDFDSTSIQTLQKPHLDTSKLKHFCEDIGLDYIIDFSGGKGYHLLPGVKDEKVINEASELIVKSKLANVQLSLEKYLDFTTLDHKVIGDVRRVLRIPTTLYVNKFGIKNGLYCRNISPEDFEKGITRVLELAKTPGEVPKKPKQNMTLEQVLQYIPEKFRVYRSYNSHEYPKLIRSGIYIPQLSEIHCPCMIKALTNSKKGSKIPHQARFEVVCWMKLCGYTNESITHFFGDKWRDYNQDKTEVNVRTINARPPDCNLLSRMYGEEGCKKCSLGKLRGLNGEKQ